MNNPFSFLSENFSDLDDIDLSFLKPDNGNMVSSTQKNLKSSASHNNKSDDNKISDSKILELLNNETDKIMPSPKDNKIPCNQKLVSKLLPNSFAEASDSVVLDNSDVSIFNGNSWKRFISKNNAEPSQTIENLISLCSKHDSNTWKIKKVLYLHTYVVKSLLESDDNTVSLSDGTATIQAFVESNLKNSAIFKTGYGILFKDISFVYKNMKNHGLIITETNIFDSQIIV